MPWQAADLLPEEVVLSPEGWDAIIRAITKVYEGWDVIIRAIEEERGILADSPSPTRPESLAATASRTDGRARERETSPTPNPEGAAQLHRTGPEWTK